jgi:predicted aldo/keto reductase-like oxidoreductase
MSKVRIQKRRDFLKMVAGGAAGCFTTSLRPVSGEGTASFQTGRFVKGGLGYRRLGRTGLSISEIALGGSPLPDPTLLRELFDRGVNYIDTSHNYDNGNSERLIGRLFAAVGRDKVFVSTKFHVQPRDTEATIIASVRGSLSRLATDYIDVLGIHGAEDPDVLEDERVLGAYEKLKKEGVWRFRGLSCHANHDAVVRKAVSSGLYDVVQVGYNVFDIQEPEREVKTYEDYLGTSGLRGLLDFARGRDVGVIAMKTLRVGGRRQNLEAYRTGTASIYQAMLKWVLADSRVTAAVTEILSREQMEEDLAASTSPLSAAEGRTLRRFVRDNGRDYCHFCGRCQESCPARVATTAVQRALAYHESYGKTARGRALYAELGNGRTVPACRDCGRCEVACPYGVSVRARLREAHRLLA